MAPAAGSWNLRAASCVHPEDLSPTPTLGSASQGLDSGPLPPAPGGLAARGSRGTPRRGLPLRPARLRPGSRPLPTGAPSTRRAITASGMARAGVLRGRLVSGARTDRPQRRDPAHRPRPQPRAHNPTRGPCLSHLSAGSCVGAEAHASPLCCAQSGSQIPEALILVPRPKRVANPGGAGLDLPVPQRPARGILWGAGREERPESPRLHSRNTGAH